MAKIVIDENSPKRKHIERTYGISLEYYNSLREIQKYKCAICRIPEGQFEEALIVDHDHNTGEVRGLLCKRCNSGLGFMKDSPKRLIRAARYLYSKKNLTPFDEYAKNVSSISENDILNLVGGTGNVTLETKTGRAD